MSEAVTVRTPASVAMEFPEVFWNEESDPSPSLTIEERWAQVWRRHFPAFQMPAREKIAETCTALFGKMQASLLHILDVKPKLESYAAPGQEFDQVGCFQFAAVKDAEVHLVNTLTRQVRRFALPAPIPYISPGTAFSYFLTPSKLCLASLKELKLYVFDFESEQLVNIFSWPKGWTMKEVDGNHFFLRKIDESYSLSSTHVAMVNLESGATEAVCPINDTVDKCLVAQSQIFVRKHNQLCRVFERATQAQAAPLEGCCLVSGRVALKEEWSGTLKAIDLSQPSLPPIAEKDMGAPQIKMSSHVSSPAILGDLCLITLANRVALFDLQQRAHLTTIPLQMLVAPSPLAKYRFRFHESQIQNGQLYVTEKSSYRISGEASQYRTWVYDLLKEGDLPPRREAPEKHEKKAEAGSAAKARESVLTIELPVSAAAESTKAAEALAPAEQTSAAVSVAVAPALAPPPVQAPAAAPAHPHIAAFSARMQSFWS